MFDTTKLKLKLLNISLHMIPFKIEFPLIDENKHALI